MDCEEVTEIKPELSEGSISDTFSFETEAMPLKGNNDYTKLMQCLILLESQRTQAVQDVDTLLNLQEEALADPLRFVQKLENGEDLGIPLKLKIPDVPDIDWTKYKVQMPVDAVNSGRRPKAQRVEEPKVQRAEKPEVVIVEKLKSRSKDSDQKPATFNKMWTADEQLKLEELLLKYPPCYNEAQRFAKIAEELGTRTLSQVTSRCQKYFKKLHKAGLTIPGRPPRHARFPSVTMHRNPRAYHKSSWNPPLFPKMQQPLLISDDSLCTSKTVDLSRIKEEPIDLEDENVSEEVRDSDEFRKLMLIKRVKHSMETHGQNDAQPNHGYKCDLCEEDPLLGTRWNCIDCSKDMSVDFCSRCLISQLESEEPHDLKHRWVAYRPVTTTMGDVDYNYTTSNYNYLDPNFQPD